MRQYWLAVASADHVRLGKAGGFMQVSHGKATPLRRIASGDGVVYYSPRAIYAGAASLRAFTAIGTVREGEPYQGDMGAGFQPFRRDVEWREGQYAPIASLLERLDLTAGKANWGYQLRFGLLALSEHDFRLIAAAMGAADD